jgi:1-deoxy-D-xylulose-5-phosphate reductoisomerase
MKKKIVILGSTGSIGKTLLRILRKEKKNICIELLTANTNYHELLKQVKLFNVKNIIVSDKKTYVKIKKKLIKNKIKIFNSFSSIKKILNYKKIDYTMSSITGMEGLYPTLEVIKFTKKIAIANKEAIICGWSLIKKQLKKNNTQFIPIDSEHFSIWSLINDAKNKDIEKIFLTASGGPFINYKLNQFKSINKKEALKHPNWKMGKKITIDSATMMNKVFEVIEAKKIFNLDYSKLGIFIHTKSYVHAVVKFHNGLTKILIHDTNMTIPIFNSLYPNHEKKIKSKNLNLNIINNLNFKKIELNKFPSVKLLKKLPKIDSLFETIIVTVNDNLVEKFLNDEIKFTDISKVLLKILDNNDFTKYKAIMPRNINDILRLNKYVRFKMKSLSI